eukprot:3748548-Karenia_brevis.AAC.1
MSCKGMRNGLKPSMLDPVRTAHLPDLPLFTVCCRADNTVDLLRQLCGMGCGAGAQQSHASLWKLNWPL